MQEVRGVAIDHTATVRLMHSTKKQVCFALEAMPPVTHQAGGKRAEGAGGRKPRAGRRLRCGCAAAGGQDAPGADVPAGHQLGGAVCRTAQ